MLNIPVPHVIPVYPWLHIHLYSFGRSWHVPCIQGEGRQSFIYTTEREHELF